MNENELHYDYFTIIIYLLDLKKYANVSSSKGSQVFHFLHMTRP